MSSLLRHLKTDHGPLMDGQGQLLGIPSGKPVVQYDGSENQTLKNRPLNSMNLFYT